MNRKDNQTIMQKTSFSNQVWKKAKKEALLAISSRAKRRGMITYGELIQNISSIQFDFNDASHRYTLGVLLGELSCEEYEAGRGVITSIVVHKRGDTEPGNGFFELANQLGYDISNKTLCWINLVKEVYRAWCP